MPFLAWIRFWTRYDIANYVWIDDSNACRKLLLYSYTFNLLYLSTEDSGFGLLAPFLARRGCSKVT